MSRHLAPAITVSVNGLRCLQQNLLACPVTQQQGSKLKQRRCEPRRCLSFQRKVSKKQVRQSSVWLVAFSYSQTSGRSLQWRFLWVCVCSLSMTPRTAAARIQTTRPRCQLCSGAIRGIFPSIEHLKECAPIIFTCRDSPKRLRIQITAFNYDLSL